MKIPKPFIYMIHILGLILVFKIKAFGQTSYELSCKAQAKEVAVQTYQSCVTEARQQQVDTIRKEYQEKLNQLKEHYNQELKKASGKESAAAVAPTNPQEATVTLRPNNQKAPKGRTSRSVAKTLPKKQGGTIATLPAQTITEDIKVIPTSEPSSIETEAAQIDEAPINDSGTSL